MIPALLIKILATGVIVIAVTVSVAQLGSRIGGILAGTPIVIGPAFYFLGREQTTEFVFDAAVSTLHALTASLVFLMAYVIAASRLHAIGSLAVAVMSWIIGAAIFTQVPGNLLPALGLYLFVFAGALLLEFWLNLKEARIAAKTHWGDLLARGAAAGILVGITTTAGAQFGPTVSGAMAGFPVGFVVISLTLYQRFGADVARATLVAAQRGMLSLVAFAAAIGVLTPIWGAVASFWPALSISLLVSAMMVGASWLKTYRVKLV